MLRCMCGMKCTAVQQLHNAQPFSACDRLLRCKSTTVWELQMMGE